MISFQNETNLGSCGRSVVRRKLKSDSRTMQHGSLCSCRDSLVAMKKPTISSFNLILVLTVYFSTVLNLSFWRYIVNRLPITDFHSACFVGSVFLVISVFYFLIFNLTVVKKVAKPFIIFLLLVGSAASFMMFEYGVYINSSMIQNVLETNVREATELITASLLLWVLLFGIAPSALLIVTEIRYQPFKAEMMKRLLGSMICLLAVSCSVAFCYKDYAGFGRNNRQAKNLINVFNFVGGTATYLKRAHLTPKSFIVLDNNPRHEDFDSPKSIPTVVIFIVGETARSMNFSLNGYERKTNPLLEKQDIVYYKDVIACGTSTAISVPCMFSHENQKNFDSSDAKFTENALDLAQKAGYEVIWLENDDGCKDVCNRVDKMIGMRDVNNPKYCRGNYCLDEALLDGLDETLSGIRRNTLIVLHTQGSHGPKYYQRYPDAFKKFLPTCDTAEIHECSREQIVNTYDNTILYTDFVLSSVIDIAKKHPKLEAGVIYVSDHGESLGENNIYLHGMPYSIAPDEQTRVPMLIWINETMRKWDHIDYRCLKDSAGKNTYSHDNLFHSLLGLLEIKTPLYDSRYDLFSPCRVRKQPPAERP